MQKNAKEQKRLVSKGTKITDDDVRFIRLVSTYTYLPTSNPSSSPRNLVTTLTNLNYFFLTPTQQKIIFALLKIKTVYPNQLRRFYKKQTTIFKESLKSLSKKGLIQTVTNKEKIEIMKKIYVKQLETAPAGAFNQLELFELTELGQNFYRELETDLEEVLGTAAEPVLREQERLQIVLKQLNNPTVQGVNRIKDQKIDKVDKNAIAAQENMLMAKIDALIIAHYNDFDEIKKGFAQLYKEFPDNKPFLNKKLENLQKIIAGKVSISWMDRVEQAKRLVANIHPIEK